ncbi:class I SAM-dependent methyltransferase [Nocardia sp. NPDC050718]|uniref:class I SAM-dependent methyltransferase n=1 Tax=Nocardia sp. NPDC050718 TaxID=3155788 RepID=UPI0033EB1915
MTAEPPPGDADDWVRLNRAHWDERAPIHVRSDLYDLDGFVAGREHLRDFEIREIGDVRGKRLLHLQCHIGTDTLGWARRGAVVTGLDFSAPAIAAARALAARIGADDAEFVEAEVYDAVDALAHRTFDIVYTGLGALCWLPDLRRWAETVAALVAPGGFLYLSEFHPVGDLLSPDDGRTVIDDYFDPAPVVELVPGSYAAPYAVTTADVTVGWRHGIGEVVSAVAAAGLRVESLREHDFTVSPRFAFLEQDERGYRAPAGMPRVPLLYSLRAART